MKAGCPVSVNIDIIAAWQIKPTGKPSTTGADETYPTGRYLIPDVLSDETLYLDFNKAYNPPCTFTDFATCVFAPEQNHLNFKVTAGETYPRNAVK